MKITDIVFDFDGTLTKKGNNVWKSIWEKLGYDTGDGSYYRELFKKFSKGVISHQDWCNLTCEAFRKKGFKKSDLIEISSRIELLENVGDVLNKLAEAGYSLHIVSGNINKSIYWVLGDLNEVFDGIYANKMKFDINGNLEYIEGTKFDFEGKAKFIKEYAQIKGISTSQILFVGNGSNDLWVHKTGCQTICINPEDDAKGGEKEIWGTTLDCVTDYNSLLCEIQKLDNEKVK